MLTEHTHTEPNWKLLPGTILDGGYEMEELLEADERRARFKIRVLGDRTIDAFASFFPASGIGAEEQIEAWELLRRVPHPNVAKPLAAGRRELEGVEVVYVVLRRPDETLNGVLGERALTAEEATEVLLSGARGLEHLGRHGLVQAALTPEQVLAAGDSIQLSAEGVRKADGAGEGLLRPKYVAPESPGGNATTAAGMWCLGATIFETLAQKTCGEGCREQAKELPLGWVLDRCLDPEASKRCKPEEVPALLKSEPPPVVAAKPVGSVATPTGAAKVAAPEEAKAASATANSAGTMTASAGANSVPLMAGGSAAAAASAAGAAAPAKAPVNVPAEAKAPVENVPQARATPSLSEARTKVLKHAEFDSLTAPNSAGRLKMSGSPAIVAAAAAASRGTSAGARFDPPRPRTGASPHQAMKEMFAGRDEGQAERSRMWMYIGAGVLVLLVALWALRSKPQKATTPIANTAAQSGAPATARSANPATNATATTGGNKAWPTRTLGPEKSSAGAGAQNPPPEPAKAAAAGKAEDNAIWRVVVYTFNRQEDAEKRVRIVNARHPRLDAEVFSPNGSSGPYLVTVGGKMTRDGASHFRSKALGSGMPRDSYIQNYKP